MTLRSRRQQADEDVAKEEEAEEQETEGWGAADRRLRSRRQEADEAVWIITILTDASKYQQFNNRLV